MSGLLPRSLRPIHKVLLCILLLTLILSSTRAVNASPACSTAGCGEIDISPGKYDQKLGVGFPTFNAVKLTYPNSTILANNVGDLLFAVTLNSNLSNPKIKWIPKAAFYRSIDIYIPPDFTGLTIGKLWTSFTNDYNPNSLSLSQQPSTDPIGPGWWRVTVKNLTVTSDFVFVGSNSNLTAHRVFAANRTQYIRIFQVTSPSIAGRYFFKTFINGTSTGAGNFPTIVVKASRDPAYISGTLRDLGNLNTTQAGKPITLTDETGARIVATGRDYLGNPAAAQAFINSTAEGQYTLFGVAPGTYNITAYAAGYIPTTKANTVSVAAAQSLVGVDISLQRSVNMTLSVLSETADGIAVPWGSQSGINRNGTTFAGNRSISFQLIPVGGTSTIDTISMRLNPLASQFNIATVLSTDFDGRVPQDNAADTSGLIAGDYYLRAYVLSYVQLDDALIHVSNQTTHIRSEIRLLRSNFLTVTVHFKDYNSTLRDGPLAVNGTLSVQLFDSQGILRGSNTTFVYGPIGALPGNRSATLEVVGLSRSRTFGTVSQFSHDYGLLPGTYHVLAQLKSSPMFSGFANVGVRDLYYQLEDVQVTLGLASAASYNMNSTRISFALIRGGGISLTLYSVDAQKPAVQSPFAFPGKTITLNIIDPFGFVYYANATQPGNGSGNAIFFYSGLLTNDYTIFVKTLGYTQRDTIRLHVVLGGNSDIAVWLVQDPIIDLTLVFKTEGLLSPISSTHSFAQPINHLDATPARVEVFDDLGNFVAANESYISNLSTIANFTLAGFDRYYGDPRFVWSGFYDTTDAASQNPGGLILYPWDSASSHEYTIRIWVDGYYQLEQLQVTVPPRGNVSVVGPMDRASRISGTVAGPDFFDIARPLSWATIDFEPNNYTTSGIIDVRPGNYSTSSLDGSFQLWVPQGRYGIGVSLDGYSTYSAQVEVPSGADMNMQIWLDNYQSSPQAMTLEPLATVALAFVNVYSNISGLDRRLLRKT